MKLTEERPYARPEAAARRLLEIANTIEPVQDGRIYIETLNRAFLFTEGVPSSIQDFAERHEVNDRRQLMLRLV